MLILHHLDCVICAFIPVCSSMPAHPNGTPENGESHRMA